MSERLLEGRTCLVTGATSGHGRAVARGLARLGADLVVHGRDKDRARRTRELIADETGKPPDVLLCDLATIWDVNRAASEFLAQDRPLHVLINNAGLVSRERQETVDGHEMTFGVNYLAPFRLTTLLLDRMKQSGRARIVNVCSDMHRTVALDLDDLELRSGYGFMKAYSVSKLCLVHFTLELASRLGNTDVTVNACDPGPVDSNIGQNNPGVARDVLRVVMRWFFPSADRAARTAIWLASSPDVEGKTGGYYKWGKEKKPRVSSDPDMGLRLWEISERLVG